MVATGAQERMIVTMKIHVDIDCTPQEARSFFGLPDLEPVHQIYVERMQALVRDGLTTGDVERLIKNWAPFVEGGFDVWTKAMQQMTRTSEKS